MPRLATAQQRGPGRVATSCIVAGCNAALRVDNGACRCNASSVLQPARCAGARQCNSAAHHVNVAVPTGATRCGTLRRGGAPVVVAHSTARCVENERGNAVHPQQYDMCTILQRRTCLPIGRRMFCAVATQFGDRQGGHAVNGEAARLVASATTESRAHLGDVLEAAEGERSVRRLADHPRFHVVFSCVFYGSGLFSESGRALCLQPGRSRIRRAPLPTRCMPSAFSQLPRHRVAPRGAPIVCRKAESVAAWHASLLRAVPRFDVLRRVGAFK